MINPKPSTHTRRGPVRALMRGAIRRAAGIIANAIGIRLTAATSGLFPRTSCRYCSTRNTKPKNAKNCKPIDTVPAVKARWANRRGSSRG